MNKVFDFKFSKEAFDELYFSNDNLNYFKDTRAKRKFGLMVYGVFGFLSLYFTNLLNSLLLILCLVFVMILIVNYLIIFLSIFKQRKQLTNYYKAHSEPNKFRIEINSEGFIFYSNDEEHFSKWNDTKIISNNNLYISFKSDINYLIPSKCMVDSEFEELRNYVVSSTK